MVLGDVSRLLARGRHPARGRSISSRSPRARSTRRSTGSPQRRRRAASGARIDALGADRDARRALAARALAGSLAGLAPLVERVADDARARGDRSGRPSPVAQSHAFETELSRAARASSRGGTFLRAEALRQWQAFVGADEITRFFSSGIGKLRGTLSALVPGTPRAPVAEVREDALADLVALARSHAGEAARRTATAWADEPLDPRAGRRRPEALVGLAGFDAALRAGSRAGSTSIADDVQRDRRPKAAWPGAPRSASTRPASA